MKNLTRKYAVAAFAILFSLSVFSLNAQTITTVAGNGTSDYSGDGGPATSAELNYPLGEAVDAAGNIYIADFENDVIRKVSTNGVITTVAGNGTAGYSGDGGLATSAELELPYGLAVDAGGNIYIADFDNNRVRKVSTNGVITTVAGNGTAGYSGDGGLATNAELNTPTGVAVDAAGNIYIADGDNEVIRKVNTSGIISTVAGNGKYGYSGDGGAATSASLYGPSGVALDAAGNIYLADLYNNRIRKVNTNGIISTVAGNGTEGYSGDGGAATSAELDLPYGLAVDAAGNIYIADYDNNVIRKVNASGTISTIAGNGTAGYSGDGGVANNAELHRPTGVTVDTAGNIYIADGYNNRIRKVTAGNPLPVTIASFTATAKNKTVATNWQTATELNTSHFNIQRSTDGSSFANIGTVKAVGSGANSYSFVDLAPSPSPIANGKLYYRLQSLDKDGATSYSKTVAVSLTNFDPRLSAISIYPNPVKDILTIGGNHIASVHVIDNLGRVAKTVSFTDATNPTISLGGLAKGAYHLRVISADGMVSGAGFVKIGNQ